MTHQHVTAKDVSKLIGKTVYAMKKDGSIVAGKLVSIRGSEVLLAPENEANNKAKTNAFVPLVLFDLLAIGTTPFFGGFGGFGGFGFPGFFW